MSFGDFRPNPGVIFASDRIYDLYMTLDPTQVKKTGHVPTQVHIDAKIYHYQLHFIKIS